jgi:hypothetical protein
MFLYPLFICETSRDVAIHVEKTRNASSGFYLPSYHWWNYVDYISLDMPFQYYVPLSHSTDDIIFSWYSHGPMRIEYDLYPAYNEGSLSYKYHSAQITLPSTNTYCYHNELVLSDFCVQLIVPGYIGDYLGCLSEYRYSAIYSNYPVILQNMTLYLKQWLSSSTDFVQVPESIVSDEYGLCNVYKLERNLINDNLKLVLWAKSVRCDTSTHMVCITPAKTQIQGCAAGTY